MIFSNFKKLVLAKPMLKFSIFEFKSLLSFPSSRSLICLSAAVCRTLFSFHNRPLAFKDAACEIGDLKLNKRFIKLKPLVAVKYDILPEYLCSTISIQNLVFFRRK